MTAPDEPEWLGVDGWFRTVESCAAVTDLLADPRIHADMLGFFEGLGIGPGPARDHIAASFLNINGPEHKRLRSLVGRWFTPKAADEIRPAARVEANRLVDTFASRGTCDFVEEFAVPYVVAVTAAFLGLPVNDAPLYMPYVRLFNTRDKDLERRVEASSAGMLGLAAYARARFEEDDGADDTIVARVRASVLEGEIPEMVGVTFIAGLLAAGNDPTINQVSLAIDVLTNHPDAWEDLAARRSEPGPVVEEILRFRPTNHQVTRRVAESFTYDRAEFTEGQHLVMRLVDANHDPDRFPKPDQFDPAANQGAHLAFGFGAHYCLGAALARVQLQEALTILTARLTCPTVLEYEPKPEGGIEGPVRMTIKFRERQVP